jgi:hypothetical protein
MVNRAKAAKVAAYVIKINSGAHRVVVPCRGVFSFVRFDQAIRPVPPRNLYCQIASPELSRQRRMPRK